MAMYHDNPNRASPPTWLWYSVETPSVFVEYWLPVSNTHMSRKERRQYQELLDLAEIHGVYVRGSQYRKG